MNTLPAFPALPQNIWGIMAFVSAVFEWLDEVKMYVDARVDSNKLTKVIAWPFRVVFGIIAWLARTAWSLITWPFRVAKAIVLAPFNFAKWVLNVLFGMFVITMMYGAIFALCAVLFQWWAFPVILVIWAATTFVWGLIMTLQCAIWLWGLTFGRLFRRPVNANA